MPRFLTILFAVLAVWIPCHAAQDAPGAARHAVEASFDPTVHRLTCTDTVTLPGGLPAEATVTLSGKADGLTVTAAGSPVRFTRSGETIRLRVPSSAKSLTFSYSLPLDAPPDQLPPTMDNPGAMASDAAAGPDWAMLMPGSLWHPEVEKAANAYRVSVSAPPGIKAVTQGALAALDIEPSRTVTTWDIPRPVGRLGLCIAPFQLDENRDGPAPAQTFLLQDEARLAPVYLQASARHLSFYANLHGPYAFEKFAVVENPLPTGYGFPSYTLLGSQVLPLPFIPATSLRHEIAHSWWGNGVLVDYSQGNWCEGLTTYVADYLAQEEDSPRAARAYRLRVLRSFAALAGKDGDMPLSRFGSRFSPASQAVGYGKAMFVFHMLRSFTGDEAFWSTLRSLYAARLFKPTSWEDIRKAFAGQPGFDAATSRAFFKQWLTRTGGPVLKLDNVTSAPNASGGHTVTATVRQAGKPYLLKLTLQADTPEGSFSTSFILNGPSRVVTLDAPAKPTRVALDPGADSFRLLAASEVPPTVNALKASRRLTVVLADDASGALKQALPRLLAGIGQENARVVAESHLSPADLKGKELLVAGTTRIAIPGMKDVMAGAPGADTALAILPRDAGFIAVFQAAMDASPEAVATAAAKITHYGTYGLLGFKDGRNVLKDAPEPEGSPLVKKF